MPEQQPPTPSKRTWIVQCFFRNAVTGEMLRDEQTAQLVPDHQEVTAAFIEARAILRRQGGVMSIGTKREEIVGEPGRVETTELLFRHETFAPIVPSDPPTVEPSSNGNGNGNGACTVCGRKSPDERPDDPPCQCQVQGDEKPIDAAEQPATS